MSHDNHFRSDANWADFATKNGIPLPSPNAHPVPIQDITPIPIEYTTKRPRQAEEHAKWREDHPLAERGYQAQEITVKAKDGYDIPVKISYPTKERLKHKQHQKLPVLLVSYGGGWINGTHTTEECWLLWPIYPAFDVVIVSVDYRLGPENKAPIWVEDAWDVLETVFSQKNPTFTSLEVELDLQRVVVAGSSAGGGISAALAQRCRDRKLPLFGAILNVPVLCDYRHHAQVEKELGVPMTSYRESSEALLTSGQMIWIWNTLYPAAESSKDPNPCPLLGDCADLPRHLILVAGQDPVRDEALAYAKRLERAGVKVDLEVYPGVPHIFGEFWELESTKKSWEDIKRVLREWFAES